MTMSARLTLIFFAALLSACASRTPPPAPVVRAPVVFGPSQAFSPAAEDVLFRALGLVGTPYRWGGNTPEGGFDCSGLVGYVFRDAANVNLPRTTGEIAQVDASTPARDRLASGDLVLFGKGRKVFHVGIYVGEGRFVHAPSTGGTVRLDRVDGPYWRDHYAGARRVLD